MPVLEHRRADAPPSATGPRRGRTSGRPGVCCSRSGMDLGSAAGTGGTFISLSDSEQRCYSGLYALCQPDSTGKPAAGKVAELFRASQLPAETLHQVSLRGFRRRPWTRVSGTLWGSARSRISDFCCVWMYSMLQCVQERVKLRDLLVLRGHVCTVMLSDGNTGTLICVGTMDEWVPYSFSKTLKWVS